MGAGTIPRPSSKKSKLNLYLDQQSKDLCNLFLLYVQVEGYQYTLKHTMYAIHIICSIMLYVLCLLYILCILNKLSILSCRPLAFTWSISLSTSFSACFLGNMFLTLYSINLPNFIVCLPLLHEILGNMFIVIELIILIL